MNPLAALAYYRHNKKRLLLLFLPVLLCVLLIFLIQILIASSISLEYRAFVETRKAYTSIEARGKPIAASTIAAIAMHEDTERVAPCILHHTEIVSLLSRVGVRVYLLYEPDMALLMTRMNLTLVSGQLPRPGSDEIILHETIAANKGLTIGDRFGNDLNPAEPLLGQHTVAGLVSGEALCGFASLESWTNLHQVWQPEEYGVLAIAKLERHNAMSRYIKYLPLTGNELSDYTISSMNLAESTNRIYLLINIIFVAVLLINSICVSFLTYLFSFGRLREFALLNMIGYNRQLLLRRNLVDVFLINSAATLVAISLALLVCLVANRLFFQPSGIPLSLTSAQAWLSCLCVPLASLLAEILAINSVFRHLDPLSLLERDY